MYNAEDYIISLKKYSRRATGTNAAAKSIYDTSDADRMAAAAAAATTNNPKLMAIENRAATLPSSKQMDYK